MPPYPLVDRLDVLLDCGLHGGVHVEAPLEVHQLHRLPFLPVRKVGHPPKSPWSSSKFRVSLHFCIAFALFSIANRK